MAQRGPLSVMARRRRTHPARMWRIPQRAPCRCTAGSDLNSQQYQLMSSTNGTTWTLISHGTTTANPSGEDVEDTAEGTVQVYGGVRSELSAVPTDVEHEWHNVDPYQSWHDDGEPIRRGCGGYRRGHRAGVRRGPI